MSEIVLSPDQENARKAFVSFLCDTEAEHFVIKGYAGTGKTTLVKSLLAELPKYVQMVNLVGDEKSNWDLALAATTNKAAEAMELATGREVKTVHSLLGIRPKKDYSTGETRLMRHPRAEDLYDTILFIDEASFADTHLLKLIEEACVNCKIIWIGDPAQLSPVKTKGTPVFNQGYKETELKEVLRQAKGNPIQELAAAFRGTVSTGEWFSFIPDGTHVQHLSRNDFYEAILTEFTRKDWQHDDSKVLAWTNKKVIGYNYAIREHALGTPELHKGDMAICNSYIKNGAYTIRTDQLVGISKISDGFDRGVEGHWIHVDNLPARFFMPKDAAEKQKYIRQAKARGDFLAMAHVDNTWIDLRAAYSCTINKSQGSTYDKVFIDLDDVARCNQPNQLARLLYVAVSRARYNVIMTGDLVSE